MASTNKTTHYELSQYVGSDKPTYLTDYNNDMSAIDTGMYNAQDKADSAYTLAGTADGKADTAITNAGTAQTDASTALTRIGTLANLTTSEKTNLVGAINEVDSDVYGVRTDINKFNLSVNASLTIKTKSNVNNVGVADIRMASDTSGSVFKLYGYITCDHQASGQAQITFDTTLRPTSNYTMANTCVIFNNGQLTPSNIYVATNGEVTVEWPVSANTLSNVMLPACIYFNSDFGD